MDWNFYQSLIRDMKGYSYYVDVVTGEELLRESKVEEIAQDLPEGFVIDSATRIVDGLGALLLLDELTKTRKQYEIKQVFLGEFLKSLSTPEDIALYETRKEAIEELFREKNIVLESVNNKSKN